MKGESATKAPSDNSKHRNMSLKITKTCRPKGFDLPKDKCTFLFQRVLSNL